MEVRKDNVLVSYGFMYTVSNPNDDDFGTYAFLLLTEKCGVDIAVSRILPG